MQNPDQPNLPFAQKTNATMFRDMQNPDQPDLPFAQSSVMSSRSRQCVIVNGSGAYGTRTNQKELWSEQTIRINKLMGYSVVPCSEGNDVKPASSPHWTKSEIKEMIEKYHGDDIKLLHDNVTGLGNAMTRAKQHRDSNAQKIENLITQRQDISTKLVNLGKSVSDVSGALEAHKVEHIGGGNGNGNGCGWDIVCHIEKLKAQIGGVALIGVAGIVGYILLKRKIKL